MSISFVARRPAGRARLSACAVAWLAGSVAASPNDGAARRPWPLRDGDRIVLLGDAFVEREGDRGFIETALVAAHPEAMLSFRNLGWSGDTVWAESRGVFDQPAKGYARLLGHLRELAPDVVVVAYGRNESYRGAKGIGAFRRQLAQLCDDLLTTAADVRLVLVTPHRFETADAAARNADLADYCEAIRAVATEKRAVVVDLFSPPAPAFPTAAITENGVHLSDAGYAAVAAAFVSAAGRTLPDDFATASSSLRSLVVTKNKLFFHRWRPANETYIFLFRSHEQGNNAAEISQFEPLVAAAERAVQAAANRGR